MNAISNCFLNAVGILAVMFASLTLLVAHLVVELFEALLEDDEAHLS